MIVRLITLLFEMKIRGCNRLVAKGYGACYAVKFHRRMVTSFTALQIRLKVKRIYMLKGSDISRGLFMHFVFP